MRVTLGCLGSEVGTFRGLGSELGGFGGTMEASWGCHEGTMEVSWGYLESFIGVPWYGVMWCHRDALRCHGIVLGVFSLCL